MFADHELAFLRDYAANLVAHVDGGRKDHPDSSHQVMWPGLTVAGTPGQLPTTGARKEADNVICWQVTM